MSVICLGVEEWQKLFNTFFFYQSKGLFNFVSRADIEEYKALLKMTKKKASEYDLNETAIIHKLNSFVQRLIKVNEACFNAQYKDKGFREVELLEPSLNTYEDKKALFKEVGSIIYNCVDNNGYNYLPQDLLDTLRQFQISLCYKIIGEA